MLVLYLHSFFKFLNGIHCRIHHIFFIFSPVDSHLGGFYLLAIMNNDAMNIHVPYFCVNIFLNSKLKNKTVVRMADYLEVTGKENAPCRNPQAVCSPVLKVQIIVSKTLIRNLELLKINKLSIQTNIWEKRQQN